MMKRTKYLIIPFIAIGVVLSLFFGVAYNCQGEEMFPIYYGSPFVFKEKSLGSSMEYFYSISGFLINVAVWSVIIALVRLAILKILDLKSNSRTLTNIYKGTVILLVIFSAFNIGISYIGMGQGFKKGSNYWYMDIDKEAKDWGMECVGEWKFWILN